MLVALQHLSKSIGAKTLFTDLDLHISPGEKIALVGRNGQGKTTLLHIIGGEDRDFNGQMTKRKNLRTVLTKQEHFESGTITALQYILQSVPYFLEYEKVLSDFENGHHENVNQYTQALEYFSEQGYFHLKDEVLATLVDFQVTNEHANDPLITLSGGEKRFVELVRMMYAKADLLLIDEPTNHMDYVGKARFITWMSATKEGMLVVTHDRDVLAKVQRIIELKDQHILSFKGNYDQYLRQNTDLTKNSVVTYQNQIQRLADAKKKVEWGLQMRAKSKAWKIRYDHWQRDYDKIKAETVKPSFWIDQESVQDLDKTVSESYHKFKEKNIKIAVQSKKERVDQLLAIKNLSLGYTSPLFSDVSFVMDHETRVFIKGRNGAGKSTFVKAILAQYKNEDIFSTKFEGEIKLGVKTKIGEYDQEIGSQFLSLTLEDAIYQVYQNHDIPIDNTKLRSILSQYLFNPTLDARIKVGNLSGGQKARFQLIKMFANTPNLLILDEPTNHLDLPSIEELENALLNYHGGILYISHDTSFIKKLDGKTIML